MHKVIIDGIERNAIFESFKMSVTPQSNYIITFRIEDLDGTPLFLHEEQGEYIDFCIDTVYQYLTLEKVED